ncbi:MAG: Sapep family Mn(2+)-dependent dipeptidase [Candidatus Limivivens sp.]|nr:Sapep family Mn(2+)-dependent dipeptidase [Candidatus Limivivens sp.]
MEMEAWMDAHEQEMLDDLAALVRIRSVAGQGTGNSPFGKACRQVLDVILQMGEKYGFSVSDCDGYAGEICWGGFAQAADCGSVDKKPDAFEDFGVWGHLDVVPEGNGWKYPPYELTREGDFLIGRGVQDNKGPVIAVLYALRFLKESGWKPQKRFRLIFGCDEEQGMSDVEYFLAHYPAPAFSFVADCGFPVCRGEKGMLSLEIGKKLQSGKIRRMRSGSAWNIVPGEAWAEIFAEGKERLVSAAGVSGHAAFPEGTVHAAGELCRKLLELPLCAEEQEWISFLEKVCQDGWGTGLGIACKDEESGRLTCNPGILEMADGVWRVCFDIRYPVTISARDLLKEVEQTAERYGFTWKVRKNAPPFCVPAQHPLVERLMEVYNREQKDGKQPYIMGGGTYAKKIPRAVGFGPGLDQHLERLGFSGSRGNCHSVDEAQSLTNLKKAVKIYANAFQVLENEKRRNQTYENNCTWKEQNGSIGNRTGLYASDRIEGKKGG